MRSLWSYSALKCGLFLDCGCGDGDGDDHLLGCGDSCSCGDSVVNMVCCGDSCDDGCGLGDNNLHAIGDGDGHLVLFGWGHDVYVDSGAIAACFIIRGRTLPTWRRRELVEPDAVSPKISSISAM